MCPVKRNDQLTEAQIRGLLAKAREAANFAYAPFSAFHVGAAVIADDGRVFTGANVENSSYSLTICAERVAIFNAVSQGARDFRALAVACVNDAGCAPCGACRQVMYEFSPDLAVIIDSPNGPERRSLRDLLPLGFRLGGPAE